MASENTIKLAANRYKEVLSATLPGDIDLATAIAIFCVESGPSGMDPKFPDRPIIRFECHKFYEYYGHINEIEFFTHFNFGKEGKRWLNHRYRLLRNEEWKPLHTPQAGQQAEWEAFYLAHNLSNQSAEPAIEATSWGAPQILGIHWKRLGFENAFQFMRFFYIESNHPIAFVRFITTDDKLYTAAKNKDFRTFAGIYNGKGQIEVYSELISKAYETASKVLNAK